MTRIWARPADKRTDLIAALSRLIQARLIAERDQALDEIDTSQWRWPSHIRPDWTNWTKP